MSPGMGGTSNGRIDLGTWIPRNVGSSGGLWGSSGENGVSHEGTGGLTRGHEGSLKNKHREVGSKPICPALVQRASPGPCGSR